MTRRRTLAVVALLAAAATATGAVAVRIASTSADRPRTSSGGPTSGGPASGTSTLAPTDAATGSASTDPDPDTPRPGATGLGDRLFPDLGNGGYQVEHYDLDLRYPTADTTQPLQGTVTATAVTSRALSSFDLDFAGRSVGSVAVNGAKAAFRRDGEELVVTPAAPLPRGARFTVTVRDFVSIAPSPDPSRFEVGLLATPDGTVWMGQPANAHQVFPSNDHPSDQATFSFRIDVPAGITAVANGEPQGSTTAHGRTVWRYVQPEPMATELAQVACGRFTVTTRQTTDGVLVRDVTPTRMTARLAPLLAAEVDHLAWMRAAVGDYPFRAFGSLVADAPFAFGGLESQTLILYPARVLDDAQERDQVMVHELTHQWFGDSVAPAGWSDVWLNEGHATWYEYRYGAEHDPTRTVSADASFEQLMRSLYGKAADWRTQDGPVASPRSGETQQLFSPEVYQGGALALYALRQKIGAPAFDRVERAWVTTYRGRSASTQDFIALASQVSGQDLHAFLQGWLYGTTLPPMPGHPDWTADPQST